MSTKTVGSEIIQNRNHFLQSGFGGRGGLGGIGNENTTARQGGTANDYLRGEFGAVSVCLQFKFQEKHTVFGRDKQSHHDDIKTEFYAITTKRRR